ncbi:right-handed parallel beta-helix repeat-containing protein [Streptomyces sp. CA-243310]|uniref:right-handed parallel beta-helix repeat-containing protein n=1 Tax=Streptomyces sp. CA-243310 TaxID=3240056 RepID=UPI003D944B78
MSRKQSGLLGAVGAVAAAALAASLASPVHAADREKGTPVPCSVPALVSAIDTANAATGEVPLRLAPHCVYTLNSANTGETGLPVVTGRVRIEGRGAVISRGPAASGLFRLFEVANGGRLTLSGLTLNGGSTSGNGGGIAVRAGGELRASDVTVRQNRSDSNGGGIEVESGATATLKDSRVRNNVARLQAGGINANGTVSLLRSSVAENESTASYGGGINIDAPNARLTVRKSSVSHNRAALGSGGFDLDNGIVEIRDSEVTGNEAATSAGGIYHEAQSLIIDSSRITRNSAVLGSGGIEAFQGLTVTNSKITHNRVTEVQPGDGFGGGGVTLYVGNATFIKTEITDNTVTARDGRGGGVYILGSNTLNVKFERSLIARNAAIGDSAFAGGISQEGGAQVTLRNTPVTANRSTNTPGGVWTDTQFVTVENSPIRNNVPANCTGSPVIVTGCTATALTTPAPSFTYPGPRPRPTKP